MCKWGVLCTNIPGLYSFPKQNKSEDLVKPDSKILSYLFNGTLRPDDFRNLFLLIYNSKNPVNSLGKNIVHVFWNKMLNETVNDK